MYPVKFFSACFPPVDYSHRLSLYNLRTVTLRHVGPNFHNDFRLPLIALVGADIFSRPLLVGMNLDALVPR